MGVRQAMIVRASQRFRTRLPELSRTQFRLADHQTFFGYYDLSPESPSGDAVLAHALPSELRGKAHQVSAEAKICLFREGDCQILQTTDLWSWQLGSRLGWLSVRDPDTRSQPKELIFFSARHDDGPGTVVIDTDGYECGRFSGCLYDASPDGRFGLGLDMARLAWARPGYGYSALEDPSRHIQRPNEGIWRVDFATGTRREIASMEEILEVEPQSDFKDAFHYLNHVSISPDGARYLVFHLWLSDPMEPDRFQARVLVGSCDGSSLDLVEDHGRPSHYTWRTGTEVIMFRLGPHVSGYRRYNLETGENAWFWDFLPVHDGHQSFCPTDPSLFLMDTYPDWLRGEQELHVYGSDGSGGVIARLRSDPRLEGEQRCDLHPRWSRDGKAIYVDTTEDGVRTLCRLSLDQSAQTGMC